MKELAEHAKTIKADAIAAVHPYFNKPASLDGVVQTIEQVAAIAPEIPFYFYHYPAKGGYNVDMLELFKALDGKVPNFVGCKYTHNNMHEINCISRYNDSRYDVLVGHDEGLASAVIAGVKGGVGSTYQIPFMIPIYKEIFDAISEGNVQRVVELQGRSCDFINIVSSLYPGEDFNGGLKDVLKLTGIDTGHCRLPHISNNDESVISTLEDLLIQNGFLE
eukprot:TRINITY_DN1409_c0_g1_i2.p1 TRINITY_DN1409_c0_g1~~TRINITY_DN1409_c0_g1_i2.p1  ORF type:complete len:220 (-),score=50.80 TRINITY_DN1409_c0_g1_i2:32-691(-)